MDCTPTFNDLLDSDERDGTENFCHDQMESTIQPQQANNSRELQSDNHSLKRKQDFDLEASLKTPTKAISSNRDSTSPWILEPIHENKIPRIEDYSLYHDFSVRPYSENSQIPILEANPVFPYPRCNNNNIVQDAFGNARRQQHEFQSVHPHRNETYKENSRLIHGQSFITDIFQPGNISDIPIDYSSPLKHDKTNALKYIENDPQVHGRKLQKCSAFYGLPASKRNPHTNKKVENEKILHPSVSQQTSDLNYGTKDEITVDKEVQLVEQNKLSLTVPVPKIEIQDDNRTNIPISPYNCNFSDSMRLEIQHIKDDRRIVKNYEEGSVLLNEVRNTPHASEQQMNAEQKTTQQKLTQQKKAENRAQEKSEKKRDLKHESSEQESSDESVEVVSTDESVEVVSTDESDEVVSNDESVEVISTDESVEVISTDESVEDENADQESAEKSAEQESAEKSAEQESAEKSAEQKNAEKSSEQESAEKSGEQESAEMRAEQENAEKSAEQESAEKNADQERTEEESAEKSAEQESADQENVEKSADKKNTRKSAKQKNTRKSANQKNTQKSADQNAEQKNAEKSVEQENSKVFTGKGYDSIEDFIQALYNNTLYKRY